MAKQKKVKLKNKLRHMCGQAVCVNGVKYQVDKDGFASVLPEHAEKMLKGKSWEYADPKDAPKEEEEAPLLDDDGEPASKENDVTEGGEEEGEDENDETETGEGPAAAIDENMDIDELKKMADGLDVSYGPNIGKGLLVERIKEAQAKN